MFVFSVALVLAIVTLRASSSQKVKWKAFWNVVEVVWLLGTGLSVLGVISAAAGPLRPILEEFDKGDLHDQAVDLVSSAKAIQEKYCGNKPVDERVCYLLGKMATIDVNPDALSDQEAVDFVTTVGKYAHAHAGDSTARAAEKLIGDFWDYRVSVGVSHREATTPVVPSWAKWVAIFTPHIFAFVFALRLGRAIAVFGP